jgi:zeta-carotene desaturase
MLTIFQFFATKTDASKLRMLSGSPAERLLKPITDYVEEKGGRLHIRWGCRCFLLVGLFHAELQASGEAEAQADFATTCFCHLPKGLPHT